MTVICSICGNAIPVKSNRFKLTAKVVRTDVSIAKVMHNLGVLLSKEEEHLLICRACNSSLSGALTRQRNLDTALTNLYSKSAPTACIGSKLRESISVSRGDISTFLTPSSSQVHTPHGTKRTARTPRSIQKKPRCSRSSGKKTRTPCDVTLGGSIEVDSYLSPRRQADMENLITEVEKHPCLYDKQLSSYRDWDAKSEIWRRISKKLGISEVTARKRWINVRDGYVKYEKKLKEFMSGSGEEGTPKYRYAAQMEFLRPHIIIRETATKLAKERERRVQEPDEDQEEDTDIEYLEERLQAVSHENEGAGTSSCEPSSSHFPIKRPPEKRSQHDFQDAMLDYFRSKRESSAVTPFFLHISQTIERLPPLVQSRLRSQIFELVNKAEIEHLSQNDELTKCLQI